MSACVGSGYCCKTAICVVGQVHYKVGPTAQCPGLLHNGERYICALAGTYREELAIGEGCCSPLFNRDREAIIKRKLLQCS